jgi:anti-anti-sigma regulatory factor
VPDCHTVLELSELRLLSAAGVTELVDLRDRLSRAAARLAIAAAPRHVRKVLTITGLDDTVILADTVADATHLITTTPQRRAALWVASTTWSCAAPRSRPPR